MDFYRATHLLTEPAQRAFCLTLFYTGCRISEALNLTWKSVDLGEETLVLRTLKQRRDDRYRAVPVPPELLTLLEARPSEDSADSPIWKFCRATGWKLIRSRMAVAGLSGIRATPKGLRHSFAITCIQNQVPLPTVQKWMGHARVETTAIYLDFVGEDERQWARRIWNTMV